VQSRRDFALLTGGGFFYSEHRATGAIGTLFQKTSEQQQQEAKRNQMRSHQSKWPRGSSEAGLRQCQEWHQYLHFCILYTLKTRHGSSLAGFAQQLGIAEEDTD